MTEVEAAARPVALPPGPRWHRLDPDIEYVRRLDAIGGPRGLRHGRLRRFLWGIGHPARARHRRELHNDRPRLRLQAVRSAVREASQEMRAAESGPPALDRSATATTTEPVMIVALDAEDVEASADALAAGAILAPGSLRWLVDNLDAAGRP
jgi:hypothetical protein